MTMSAIDAARDIYVYGRNSLIGGTGLQSLRGIARDSSRSLVPQYKVYSEYFKDDDYADTIITNAFNAKSPYDFLSTAEKTEVVTSTLQVMVMYMGALAQMYDAVGDCSSGDINRNALGAMAWDEVAASLTGSIEGTQPGGASGFAGQLMYDLAKATCLPMNTCTPPAQSQVTTKMETLLYAGQAEIKSLNCNALASTVSRLQSLLKVPLFQAALSSIANLAGTTADSNGGEYARTYVYTLSILPLINQTDPASAEVLRANVDFLDGANPAPDGQSVVFKAVADAIQLMPDVSCSAVGQINGLGVCASSFDSYQSSGATRTCSDTLLFLSTLCIGFILYLM